MIEDNKDVKEKVKNICKKCGTKLGKEDYVYLGYCENCYNKVHNIEDYSNYDDDSDSGESYTGLYVVSFLIPIVGLIVYSVNIVQNPEVAKPVGKWALIGFIVGIVIMGIIYGSVI